MQGLGVAFAEICQSLEINTDAGGFIEWFKQPRATARDLY